MIKDFDRIDTKLKFFNEDKKFIYILKAIRPSQFKQFSKQPKTIRSEAASIDF